MKRIIITVTTILFLSLVLTLGVGSQAPAVSFADETQAETFLYLPLVYRRWTPPAACPVGVHLSAETASLLVTYRQEPGTVLAFTYRQAESVFPELGAWQRVIVQPSLEGLRTLAQRAAENGMPYEALLYTPDRRPATPQEEWQNLVAASQTARDIANQYGKRLILAPGITLMAENTELYPAMAALADGWFIDASIFQNTSPPGDQYRWDVSTVVDRLHQGNEKITIWVQIALDPQAPDPDNWLAYWNSLRGLVAAADIATNFKTAEDPGALLIALQTLMQHTCTPSAP
ncbi:MAG: hypothetical protein ACOCXI_02490 [Chloroflexota bacterium]